MVRIESLAWMLKRMPPKIALNRRLMPLYIVMLALCIAGFLVFHKRVVKTKNLAKQGIRIQTHPIETGDFSPQIQLFGLAHQEHPHSLSAGIGAKILHIHVRQGQRIKSGQLLISLDAKPFELHLAKNLARRRVLDAKKQAASINHQSHIQQQKTQHHLLILAAKQWKRQHQLFLKKATTINQKEQSEEKYKQLRQRLNDLEHRLHIDQAQIQELDAQIKQIDADIDQTKLDLHHCRVKAPISGRISKLQATLGTFITPQQTLLSISHPRGLIVTANRPLAQSKHLIDHAIENHQPMTAVNIEHPEQTFIFSHLSGHVSSQSLTQSMIFTPSTSVDIADQQSMILRVTLPKQHRVHRLPLSALFDPNTIFTIQNSRLVRHQIERIGIQWHDKNDYLLFRQPQLKHGMLALAQSLPQAAQGLLVDVDLSVS